MRGVLGGLLDIGDGEEMPSIEVFFGKIGLGRVVMARENFVFQVFVLARK